MFSIISPLFDSSFRSTRFGRFDHIDLAIDLGNRRLAGLESSFPTGATLISILGLRANPKSYEQQKNIENV